ncbi:MAG: PEP/pyruvate-binding domain-containing protein [bacterium]
MKTINFVSSGVNGLDNILQGLRKGDNVVWQVDRIEDYLYFVRPYIEQAKKDGRKIIYIRFASHPPLIKDVKTYDLDATVGFESFSKEVHEIITLEGDGAFYLFDCLSDLLFAWATDLMIGNFFMVTCPYLFKLNTLAYFAILRNNHSYKTIARIRETTQLLLDVYSFEGKYYLHPLKVWNRYSPTMFLPHIAEGEKYLPLTSSVDAARLLAYMSAKGAETAERNLDYWDRLFIKAEELTKTEAAEEEKNKMVDQLLRIMVGREERMLSLVKKYFALEDLIAIKNRMIGTGYIGGKAVGMLLARKILANWEEKLEAHDSFYIGSDVFYSYIVQNGWWDLWLEQKTTEGFFAKAADLKEKLLTGNFPDEIREQFNQLLEYYGQSPIIIRSSSLLEDGFGNAFAGKYESIFCVNQGSLDERYVNYERTVREVFASTMNEDALTYRQQRGLGLQDEQMALLVQRVSGTQYQKYFFPFLAGVGVSYNTFVWNQEMDPKAGMLRLVFGLGTRAVNRVEGDYPRVVALDKPLLQPYAGVEDKLKFSQHEVDLLDIEKNELISLPLSQLLTEEPAINLELIAQRSKQDFLFLTFDQLLSKTEFAVSLQQMLARLEAVYEYPVDVEFTANYNRAGKLQVNVLQCRPLQAKGPNLPVKMPGKIKPENSLIETTGNFMGGNVSQPINKVIYIDTREYAKLLYNKKFTVARLIGRLNREIKDRKKHPTMLIGPGRWGTKDATLGVPVSFAEINNFAALVEVAEPESGFMPELSFGSHFFLDLVEAQIFYLALFNGFKLNPSLAKEELHDDKALRRVVRIFDFSKQPLILLSDIATQRVVCYSLNDK